MSWTRVIFLNFGLMFGLIGLLLLTPPLVYSIYSLFLNPDRDGSQSRKLQSELSLYENYPWAERHFKEFGELPTTYYDFITWRRDDYSGETINITNGVRHSTSSQLEDGNKSDYYFFGGSTTWGTGVNDANTFPSIFAQKSGVNVQNLGETGYIARQSLSYLNNLIINRSINDMSLSHVVFYDGVNDVAHRCRSEIKGLGTGRETQIRKKLSKARSEIYSFSTTFDQLQQLISSVTRKFFVERKTDVYDTYDCSSNSERAHEVAKTLVDTWQVTSNLVEHYGGKFTAILQPVSFIGSPDIDYMRDDAIFLVNDFTLAAQYHAVYPIIKQIAEKRNIEFIDLTHIYDECNNCYVDFCHVGPQAHQILATYLIENLL
jgi:hypothetical protein